MITTKVEIVDRGVSEAFGRLVAMGEDPAPALDAVGRLFKTRIQQGFQTSTDPYGRPWAPLRTRAGQPLLDKGHLMNSVDYHVEGNAVEVGTNKPYAPVHQFGATIEAKPGKFWRSEHTSVGKRGQRTYTVTQPAKLVFLGPGGTLIFATKVTIPARRMFPLDGLPQDWSTDALEAVGDAMRAAWDGGRSG